ncbi:cGMP-dependent 3',5'-cyclic phosphodiesterase-like isoform X2 [Eriocheir sinensis]|uniref:cGMP-dependent 3',5'-cyclic phosphodiesterase-like isoform X2 n=1 Tax=Eriocheir sinensis TaxID=95602 RepID=UPI0021C984B5|nr:cGMP-dependent 3',5'-cyclic phosphodiesterase-like isoform X2 [Eriocheir sinensis]
MGSKLTCAGSGTEDSTMGQEEPAKAEEDATDGRGQGGEKGGGKGAKEEEEVEKVAEGEVRSLLELVSSLSDQNAAGMQVKVNHYLATRCGAGLVFLILVSDDEELSVHVLGSHRLSCPVKIPVSNNSFSTALSSRRPITLADIEPSHREDLWRLLGLIHDSERFGAVRRVCVDPGGGGEGEGVGQERRCLRETRNGSAKSVDGSTPATRRLFRDMSVDQGMSGGPDDQPRRSSAAPRMAFIAHKPQRAPTFPGPDDNPPARLPPIVHSSNMPPVEANHAPKSPNKMPKLGHHDSAGQESTGRQCGSLSLVCPASLLCVPVAAPGRDATAILAVLVDKQGGGDFTVQDVHVVTRCFRCVAGILMTTAEAERERRLRTQCQALLTVAQNLFTHLDDVSVLLREIMAEARQLTDAERCSLFLLDREHGQLVAKVFDGERKEESSGEVRLPATQGIAGHVASTGHLLNIRDAYAHPLFYRGFDECTGFKTRNILCFPIKQDGEVIGVAELCNKTTGLHFTRFDEEIATAFSIYCGISISNSLLYKKVSESQVRSKLSNELMMFHMKVTKEEVDRLVQADVPPLTHFHRDFCSFRYFPRQLADPCTTPAILSMVESLGMITKFRLSRESLARFTLMVRKGYRDPPYHNWLHAFSVTHFAFLTLQNLKLVERNVLTPLEALALLVSSMCHDLDHRGTTNSFQVASNSVLASLYSSEGSVMERHHLAQAMCILNTDDCNFLENLSREEYTKFLDLMRDIILATDLAHHLRIVSELRQVASKGYEPDNPRHHELLICLLMTAADLSDQTKDWHSSKHVAELIYKEFFTQGDLEKAMGNMPLEMMDREKAFIPELQLQFLDDVAIPVYEIVAKLFPEAEEPYSSIKANRRNWSRLRDVYKRRKHESTSSLEVFEDDSLDEELERDES